MKLFDDDHESRRKGASGTKVVILLIAVAALAVVATYTFYLLQAPQEESPAPVAKAPEPEPKAEPKPPRPTPKRESSTTGGLSVTANVEGATLYIDGEPRGALPYDLADLKPGSYEIKVSMDGYVTFVSDVRIRAGRTEELDVTLSLAPASLRVLSDVPGASVFLDRQYLGQTPLKIDEVAAGSHQLTVSADGYDIHAETVEISTGHRDIKVSFKDVTLDESITVVHKHRLGNCEGELVADATGLQYRTEHKDGFSTPFEDLERFDVDYIEKNLNVKVKGGRNYNFTEKSGDADALFVFHREVEAFLTKAP